ncbi:hypothetical protein ICL81_04525 [Leucobacter sp. cx-328]|uniref:hypothetical protein n=1 Tax=unclassified Leucobacter TaxID=2621730 RepID=UPI00165DFEF3|nr:MULTISPECIES: hypothetical protein [unclassified Leucobacter]MBC9943791.1 hypothetical protein [Leucobacter sp. cx-328]
MSTISALETVAHDCPDCLSDTNIVHIGDNIHVVQISHDDHCPTLAKIEARKEQ